MKTYELKITCESFEELKETVLKLGSSSTSATVEIKNTAASVMTEPKEVEAKVEDVPVMETPKPKAAPKAPSKAKKSLEAIAPLEVEEMEEVPSPYAPSQPISNAKPTIEVAPTYQAPAFNRAETIAKIQETAELLGSKITDIEQKRAFITECFALANLPASSMTQLPDAQMQIVFQIFFNRVQGLLNGNMASALV